MTASRGNLSWRRPLKAGAALLTLLALAGCPDPDGPFGPGVDACLPALQSTSAAPMETLLVTGVPAAMLDEDLVAGVRLPGSVELTPVVVERESGGNVSLLVPVHPAQPVGGGKVEVVITAGEVRCRPASLTVEGLPMAPGTTEEAVNLLDSMVTHLARAMGANEALLKGSLAELPPELVPLGLVQRFLDHPENPNSLKALLAGTAPVLEGQPLDRPVLDGLLAQSGVLAPLRVLADSLATLGPPPAEEGAGAMAHPAAGPSLGAATPASLLPSNIRTAASLNHWMRNQAFVAGFATQQVQLIEAGFSNLVAVLALFPPLQGITTTAGVLLFAKQVLVDATQSMLPSELQELTFFAAPTTLNEDEATPGHWSDARLTAVSQEYRLTQPTFVDGVLVGLGVWGDKLNALMKKNPAARTAVQKGVKFLLESIAGNLNAATGTGIASYDPLLDALVFKRFTYGPVNVSSGQWTMPSVAPSPGAIKLVPTDRTAYLPAATGTADLVIRTPGLKTIFNGKVIEARQPIEVRQMLVEISPASSQMWPGGIAQFLAVVRNASDERVTWSASAGTIDQKGYWTAPSTPGTYTITATSVSRPQRKATATVEVKPDPITVAVSPSSLKLAPGAQQSFSATVAGTTNQTVQWSATAGAINAQGLFTAPQQEGTVTITARSAQDPGVIGTATVEVRAPSQVRIRIIPAAVTLAPQAQQLFVAEVEGTTNTAVEWRDSWGGTINQNGLFKGPYIMSGSQTITITARSKEDPAAVAQAIVSFDPAPPLCLAPQYTFWNSQTGKWSPCGEWGI